jgi:hypothetical protein
VKDRIRNLTEDVQFQVFLPDVSQEDAQKNVPWVMRFDLPKGYQFMEVVEIDQPLNHVMSSMGMPPTKTVGYVFEVPSHVKEIGVPLFVTSVFGSVDVPWPDKGYGKSGDLTCLYLGCTSHSGIPLFHAGLQVCHEQWEDRLRLADEFQKELEAGYLFVKPKEYDSDKRLQALMQAHRMGQHGSPGANVPSTEAVEEPVEPPRPNVGDPTAD